MPSTSPDLLTLAIGAGLISAIVSSVLVPLFEAVLSAFGSSRRNWVVAKHLAVRLAVILEDYGYRCAEAIGDLENYDNSDGVLGRDLVGIPPLPTWPTGPEDADGWRALKDEFVDQCLSFPNVEAAAKSHITFVGQLEGHPGDTARDETLGLGLKAFELAGALRQAYRWPEFRPAKASLEKLVELREKYSRKEAHRLEQQLAANAAVRRS